MPRKRVRRYGGSTLSSINTANRNLAALQRVQMPSMLQPPGQLAQNALSKSMIQYPGGPVQIPMNQAGGRRRRRKRRGK